MEVIDNATNPTPSKMLKLYRQNLTEFEVEQVQMFLAMPASERMEFLFYMCINNNKVTQFLHKLIDPEAAETRGMPSPETEN